MRKHRRTEMHMACTTGYLRALAGGVAAVCCLAPGLGWAAEDPRDATFLAPVLQRALETARTDVEVPWNNPATGNRGTIVVERTFYREPATPCRVYVRAVESAAGAPQVTRGTGCRDSAGLWLLEEEPETVAATGPRSRPPGTSTPPPPEAEPEALAEAGPSCPDTVLVPMPVTRPPAFAYTLPARAEL
jgi:surface antigen